jgi:LacI family transcriptional regulator, repressor for deo operon, udp, cdd, tsx, nupC, and nupG
VAATIVDVARQANVSVATVSRALRGLPNVAPQTRARVLAAANELHYVADPHASRLAAGRTFTVGLVVPKLGQWYYARIFEAIDSVLVPAGYDVLPFALTGAGARERFLDRLPFRKRVDGLIVVDVPMADSELERLAATSVPIVTVGLRTERFSSLTVANREGARTATEHLISLGHERIGLIGGEDFEPFAFTIPGDRRGGFEDALRARALEPVAAWMVSTQVTMAGGAEAMQRLLSADGRPTGVVAMSDEMAIGAMQVARDLGLAIPADLSIVGFDDHEIAEYIGLTTIRQDVGTQGHEAATWLLEALVGEPELHHRVLPTRLVVRRTTGPPPTPGPNGPGRAGHTN